MPLHREASITPNESTSTVTVQLVRYGDARTVNDGAGNYREIFEPGSLELADKVHVKDSHSGVLIGHVNRETFTDDGTAPTVDLTIADTTAGRDLNALIDAGSINDVSIEFEPIDPPHHRGTPPVEPVHRTRTRVKGVAFAFRPAHDAPVLAVREEEPTMTDTTTDTPTGVTLDDIQREIRQYDEELRRDVLTELTAPSTGATHELAQYATFDDFFVAQRDVTEDDDAARALARAFVQIDELERHPLLARALVDQITDNNPGVMPPGWIFDIKRIVDQGRPLITAFGTTSLPASGMSIDWPYYDGDPLGLIDKQAAEKTEVHSARVDIKKDTVSIETYAGASDISWQLLRRSQPSYREAYLRIMTIGYGAKTDEQACVQVSAAAGQNQTYDWSTGDPDGSELREAIGIASRKVETATGMPAQFVILPSANFDKLWAKTNIADTAYPVQNVSGGGNAATLRFTISGLPVVHDPYLAEATGGLVSNSSTWTWNEDGPMVADADNPDKLGTDVAVWGMGVGTAFNPNGIITLNNT